MRKSGNRFFATIVRRQGIEHDAKKWEPVFRKNRAATRYAEHDVIQSNHIML
jgi:hypothetical protein